MALLKRLGDQDCRAGFPAAARITLDPVPTGMRTVAHERAATLDRDDQGWLLARVDGVAHSCGGRGVPGSRAPVCWELVEGTRATSVRPRPMATWQRLDDHA